MLKLFDLIRKETLHEKLHDDYIIKKPRIEENTSSADINK